MIFRVHQCDKALEWMKTQRLPNQPCSQEFLRIVSKNLVRSGIVSRNLVSSGGSSWVFALRMDLVVKTI
jgi:hypothetical protein